MDLKNFKKVSGGISYYISDNGDFITLRLPGKLIGYLWKAINAEYTEKRVNKSLNSDLENIYNAISTIQFEKAEIKNSLFSYPDHESMVS